MLTVEPEIGITASAIVVVIRVDDNVGVVDCIVVVGALTADCLMVLSFIADFRPFRSFADLHCEQRADPGLRFGSSISSQLLDFHCSKIFCWLLRNVSISSGICTGGRFSYNLHAVYYLESCVSHK